MWFAIVVCFVFVIVIVIIIMLLFCHNRGFVIGVCLSPFHPFIHRTPLRFLFMIVVTNSAFELLGTLSVPGLITLVGLSYWLGRLAGWLAAGERTLLEPKPVQIRSQSRHSVFLMVTMHS